MKILLTKTVIYSKSCQSQLAALANWAGKCMNSQCHDTLIQCQKANWSKYGEFYKQTYTMLHHHLDTQVKMVFMIWVSSSHKGTNSDQIVDSVTWQWVMMWTDDSVFMFVCNCVHSCSFLFSLLWHPVGNPEGQQKQNRWEDSSSN